MYLQSHHKPCFLGCAFDTTSRATLLPTAKDCNTPNYWLSQYHIYQNSLGCPYEASKFCQSLLNLFLPKQVTIYTFHVDDLYINFIFFESLLHFSKCLLHFSKHQFHFINVFYIFSMSFNIFLISFQNSTLTYTCQIQTTSKWSSCRIWKKIDASTWHPLGDSVKPLTVFDFNKFQAGNYIIFWHKHFLITVHFPF